LNKKHIILLSLSILLIAVGELCIYPFLPERSIDPKAQPYVFQIRDNIRYGIDRYISSVPFLNDTTYHQVGIHNYQSDIHITVTDTNRVIDYNAHGLPSHLHFRNSVDMDADGKREILFQNNFPNHTTIKKESISKDSIVVGYFDPENRLVPFFTKRKPQEWNDSRIWSNSFSVLQTPWHTPAETENCFFLVREGEVHNYLKKGVQIYEKGRIPQLVLDLETGPGPDNAHIYSNSEGIPRIVIGGTAPCQGKTMAVAWRLADGSVVKDTLIDTLASVLQINESGEIQWAKQFSSCGGPTHVYASDDLKDPLVAIFSRIAFLPEDEPPSVHIRYLDRESGDFMDSLYFDGLFSPLIGYAVEEQSLVGLIQSDKNRARWIDKRGILGREIPFFNNSINRNIPFLRIIEDHYAFAYQIDVKNIILNDIYGKQLAVIEGDKLIRSIRYKQNGITVDRLLIRRGELTYEVAIVDNPFRLWWFWRNRWQLLVILLPPLFIWGIHYYREFKTARQRELKLLRESKQKLETEVKARTVDLEIEIKQRRFAENELETIFNSSMDGIVTVDSSTQVVRTNHTFNEMFACEANSFKGVKISSIKGGYFVPLTQIIEKTIKIKSGVQDFYLTLFDTDNKQQVLKITTSLLKTNGTESEQVVTMIRDVTRLFQLEMTYQSSVEYSDIIGNSSQMQDLFNMMKNVSGSLSNVLILGESGTGKELVANAIHFESSRSEGPIIKVNCAALAGTLLESELFGHVKGAFTGAIKDRIGRFEAANNGTIFLDEIGELSPDVQAKLLRVLQDGEYQRVGESKNRKTNARLIAATNQNLIEKIQDSSFREDLFYRLNVVKLSIPSLCERAEDIPLLVDHFREFFNIQMQKSISLIDDDAMSLLIRYNWPGNIRELRNCIERSFIICGGDTILPGHLPVELSTQKTIKVSSNKVLSKSDPQQLNNELDHTSIMKALNTTYWKVTAAAKLLGISRAHLYRKMKDLNINRPDSLQ
jgi:PAS domain S-box-containing protein